MSYFMYFMANIYIYTYIKFMARLAQGGLRDTKGVTYDFSLV